MPGGIFDQLQAQFEHAEQLAAKDIRRLLEDAPEDVAEQVFDLIQQRYLVRVESMELLRLVNATHVRLYKELLRDASQLPRTDLTNGDLRAIEYLAKSDLVYLEKFVKSDQLRARITEWVRENYDGKATDATQFLEGLTSELKLAQYKVDEIVNTSTSHSRVFGQVNSFRSAGAKTFEIVGPDDAKTCGYCLEMLGRQFDVAQEINSTDKFINDGPEAAKDSRPFLKGSLSLKALENLDDAEVQDLGFATPPYHPSCRHSLKAVAFYANTADIPYPIG